MKRLLLSWQVMILLMLAPTAVRANDFLQLQKHYSATAAGVNKVHFKLPVYSRGGYNYYVMQGILNKSYAWYKYNNGQAVPIFFFDGERCDGSGVNAEDSKPQGAGFATMRNGLGILEITNLHNGQRQVVPSDNQIHYYYVKKTKESDNDNDYVTWMEFDWYPPEALDDKQFSVGVTVALGRTYYGEVRYTYTWELANELQGNAMIQKPELYTPYFHAVDEAGPTGYGSAAIPYITYLEPISYVTSLDTTTYKTSQQSGTIVVSTTDTIQEQFYATFKVYRQKGEKEEGSSVSVQQSSKMDIPAFHRIYDFKVEEEMDSTNTFTGKNLLSWQLKYPEAYDLVSGDIFEVQRALKSDFSDAETIKILNMTRGKGVYTTVDDSREIWTGNAALKDTVVYYQLKKPYRIYDAEGEPYADLNVELTSTKATQPSVPVYYRVRRASSSIWGWEHDFAQNAELEKHNFLAPLDSVQADYTLDPEYEKNRKVHFNIHIDNREIKELAFKKEECEMKYTVDRYLCEDTATLTVTCPISKSDVRIQVLYPDFRTSGSITEGTWKLPVGTQITVYDLRANRNAELASYRLLGPSTLNCRIDTYTPFAPEIVPEFSGPSVDQVLAPYKQAITDSLFTVFQSTYEKSYGRCMWDRTARLILRRTLKETGQVMDHIIPQDSIVRQADGSWIASYTDVADIACSNYSYAARIDQSDCDIHVLDSAWLKPVVIHGPSLYFDEAASIASFTATQGDISYKQGVVLRWQPSSQAVDDYALLRVEKDSDAAADTIYTGIDNSYMDETAVPGKHYEYTVVARFECQTKHTENSATAEGWRTPYGEISGLILMPDNTGMAGVKVDLEDEEGTTVQSVTTGADGRYLFDSLRYTIGGSTQYAVIPAHTYATFSYNYTSAQSASITLSADHAVASGVNFANTATTRLSGRVLYKLSTIPVAGAMFKLNGDTVRRMSGVALTTGTDGNFEFEVTKGQPYVLQVFKPGHVFEGDGILHVEEGVDTFALRKPLDGVRFYDQTKVRLAGRVAGGIDQQDLPTAFGKGTNNLGEDVQLVLQLEGDNTAHIVHDPNDLSRDTFKVTVPQIVTSLDTLDVQPEKQVGQTKVLFEKKRIIINPDPETGEYVVDLFPVKYKVVQATAKGYSTLFATGAANETFDLTATPLTVITDSMTTPKGQTLVTSYNAVYDRIYRSPVQVKLKQIMYGMEMEGYGEPSMGANTMNPFGLEKTDLYTQQEDGSISYLFGYPIFIYNTKYQFEAQAYEDYYYNNDPLRGRLDRVPQRGGSVMVRNGLVSSTNKKSYELNSEGKNRAIWLSVTNLQTQVKGDEALSTVSIALTNQDGSVVETDAFRAFVTGDIIRENELTSTEADISLMDIIRDPGGNGSSAWVESGTTYSYSYTESYDISAGINFTPKYGLKVTNDIGIVTIPGPAGGTAPYLGGTFETSKQISVTIPIVHSWSWGHKYTYTFSTTDKISTSSKKNKTGIGSNADVFVGLTTSMLSGKAQSVSVINDSLFQQRKPAVDAGTMRLWAKGTDKDGNPFYLVTGEKTVLGSTVNNTFVYSQYYILETMIPQLALERSTLLMNFKDSAEAQAAANELDEPVYWYIDSLTALGLKETLKKGSYIMFTPDDSDKPSARTWPDRMAAINNMIIKWVNIVIFNEKEKVMARYAGQPIGTYSVSFGNSLSHSDSYSAYANYNEMPQNWGLVGTDAARNGAKVAAQLGASYKQFAAFFKTHGDDRFGKPLSKALDDLLTDDETDSDKDESELGTVTNKSKFTFQIEPVLDFKSNNRTNDDVTHKKNTGFTLVADDQGDITVAVYRANVDSIWKDENELVLDNLDAMQNDESALYGSYVFYTLAGATYCIHEQEEKTQFYNPGTVINNATMAIAKPEISINTYEVSNVPSDQRAKFVVELKNAGQQLYGFPSTGTSFSLSLTTDSNPHGAKVYMNGAPLVQGLSYFLTPGQVVRQVLEVERGEVDDYENLCLYFSVGDCVKTYSFLNFSVHFIPESGPVEIASPRQNWVMNTLSPQDSIGYYLPIDITGFDIHYKNFDHIEFQYKLAAESDEAWVNQCSFYANDSLYERATGNKAMIVNGRIPPFRFYGERDPKELEYDIRAVCFCRHGSGFVTKASPVIRGTKDTRPPVLFGVPQPANSILGIGDDLKLRFSEPIAGNYLDEDNNFQLRGVTNETGITAGTSVHFDGTAESYAITKTTRSLRGKSFSLDMLVRPTNPAREEYFFTYSSEDGVSFSFGKSDGNRLFAEAGDVRVFSKPLESPMLAFTRVILTYDKTTKLIRFFAGTAEVTDPSNTEQIDEVVFADAAPLLFGQGFDGDMLEARLWTKALTKDEIAATNGHYLTGYERELSAYYRMNEGKGEVMSDKANGATLYLNNATWKQQKGISLALDNQAVELAGDLLGRTQSYDETMMFWFKTSSANAPLFRAGWVQNDSVTTGTLLAMENGDLVLHNGGQSYVVSRPLVQNEWHQFVLAISCTYNTVAVYLDGEMTNSLSANKFAAVNGAMYLGGEGFRGNFDELAVFEQMLPATLIQEFYYASPVGDEMGLMGYLPFQEQRVNSSGVMELFYSPNDQRVFRDPDGNEVKKLVPLVVTKADNLADKTDHAPVRTNSMLSKLNFGWTFNQEELLVNLRMQDSEINKQTIYVTVRDVEDLHGNPMPSPVTWAAFVDLNPIHWDNNKQNYFVLYDEESGTGDNCYYNMIVNATGRRHQYTVESLPDWLTVNIPSGSIQPMETKEIKLCPKTDMPVGVYTDIIYLTDENGLSDPLYVEYTVKAECPYSQPDDSKYTMNMSICGQVVLSINGQNTRYDIDPEDKVIALYNNECVGMTNIELKDERNTSRVHLTVYGDDAMVRKPLTFILWQASTGKTLSLIPDKSIVFAHGYVYGCMDDQPVLFITGGSETQNIKLSAGWSWISSNLKVNAPLSAISSQLPWSENDLFKNPENRQFSVYSDDANAFIGSLTNWDYKQIYMARMAKNNILRLSGEKLTDEDRQITLRGNGQWNVLPCLLDQTTPLAEALADYYDHATPGDIIKSRGHFAYFSSDKRWEGDLTALKPGEGYLMRRMGTGTVTVHFYNQPASAMRKSGNEQMSKYENEQMSKWANPSAATNMTMIATINNFKQLQTTSNTPSAIKVYVGSELAGIAMPMTNHQSPMANALYFLTIQSDAAGAPLRFETEDGTALSLEGQDGVGVLYFPDAHHGTLKKPVVLTPADSNTYKTIEDNHIIIIRNNEKYDITGKKL